MLSSEQCGLDAIHIQLCEDAAALDPILLTVVPEFVESSSNMRRVKLLVIDTFSNLFNENMVEKYLDRPARARDVRRVSRALHVLATKYQLAVVTLGTVGDRPPKPRGTDKGSSELRYSDQERLFARGDSIPGEDAVVAILGYTWPAQLNVRVMMNRTSRTQLPPPPPPPPPPRPTPPGDGADTKDDDARPSKRRRLSEITQATHTTCRSSTQSRNPISLRRLSVLYSSVAPCASTDYMLLPYGLITIPGEDVAPIAGPSSTVSSEHQRSLPPVVGTPHASGSILSYATAPSASVQDREATGEDAAVQSGEPKPADDEDEYWRETEDGPSDEQWRAVDVGAGAADRGSGSKTDDEYWNDGDTDSLYATMDLDPPTQADT